MKKQNNKRIYILLGILFLISISNLHIERYETTKDIIKTVDTGFGHEQIDWVKVPNGFEDIYCDKEITYCDYDSNPNEEPLCFEYVSNVVGAWKSKYIKFKNFEGKASCVIKKKINRFKITIK